MAAPIYDFEWHKTFGDKTSASALKTLQMLWTIQAPHSVLDIGCGDGRWLAEAQTLGAAVIQGVDGPWTQLDRLLIPAGAVHVQDLSTSVDLNRRYDLAMSLEVAEHVAAEHSETFVSNLVRHSDLVLFGAAIPYQGGYRHINEQWQSYWAGLFAQRGYRAFDLLRPHLWNDRDVHYWYKQNMLVYVNGSRRDLIDRVKSRVAAQLPLDVVHPEQYEPLASYDEIVSRRLLAKLPAAAAARARRLWGRK